MNTSRDNLPDALRRWRVAPPPDPNFRAAVWQRIERARAATSWGAYLRAHAAAWTAAAALALLVGGFTGRALAVAHTRADRETIVTAYLVELDPRVQAVLKR